jgi:type IV pilus assembly protein PilM
MEFMALPYLNGKAKKRDQILAIDLGGRTTKAICVQRKADGLALTRYALLDAPIYERHLSAGLLSEHLKTLYQALETRTRLAVVALGVGEALTRHAELPQMPVSDMRQVLKNNSKNYLQQDLTGHVFDCSVLPPKATQTPADKGKPGANPKFRVLVAGAKRQTIDDVQAAIRSAGLTPCHMLPGVIGPVNAFELAAPEVFAREVVALVDVGFKNSTICLLDQGELVLSRVVGIGGDRLTNGLAEALRISYAEAEGIKIGMPSEVQSNLESLIVPLGRELRASIDFFEHQYDRSVARVYIGGGSARSDLIVQTLQSELFVDCKPWNPVTSLQLSLPPQQTAEIDHVAPQLSVAVGAALAAM